MVNSHFEELEYSGCPDTIYRLIRGDDGKSKLNTRDDFFYNVCNSTHLKTVEMKVKSMGWTKINALLYIQGKFRMRLEEGNHYHLIYDEELQRHMQSKCKFFDGYFEYSYKGKTRHRSFNPTIRLKVYQKYEKDIKALYYGEVGLENEKSI
jgi:hypothetical protein